MKRSTISWKLECQLQVKRVRHLWQLQNRQTSNMIRICSFHPTVKDSSLGLRVFEGNFFGNEHSSPLVRAYMQGFTERDLANFHLPLCPVSSKKSERISQLKESVENTLPPAPTQAHTTQKVDAQTQSEDTGIPSSPPQLKELYIDNIPDHQLPDFVSTRQLQLHFPTGRFWDESLGSWTMKCVSTQKITGRKHVTLEHISGDNTILTCKYQSIKCPLTISPLPRESRDVSLRATIKINFPSAKTLIDLLPYYQVKLSYPLHSGEKQVIQRKQREATEQIDQIDLNTHRWHCTRPVVSQVQKTVTYHRRWRGHTNESCKRQNRWVILRIC